MRCEAGTLSWLPKASTSAQVLSSHWVQFKRFVSDAVGIDGQGDINISAPSFEHFEAMAGSLGEELSGGFLMMPRAEDMPEVGTKIYRRFAGGGGVRDYLE